MIKPRDRTFISVVTPAFNEQENLPLLHQSLHAMLDRLGVQWEWIIIDDHSTDATFTVVSAMAKRDPRVRGVRLARNFGSHVAMACGLHGAQGDCAVVMAADMQDPPEVISQLLAEWKNGVQVVWAARSQREGQNNASLRLSKLYYCLMRRFVGLSEMPASGADFFLLDQRVLEAFSQFQESNVSILALISWMGFRQSTITYDKKARLHGKSGWSVGKKTKLLLDSITSFSYLPIRLISYLGFLVASGGFIYAASVIPNAFAGRPPEGWTSLIVVILVLGGIQMIMIGVLGEYVWRALDESRRRPRYLIEEHTSTDSTCLAGQPSSLPHR